MTTETAARFETDANAVFDKFPFLKLGFQEGVPFLTGELKIIDNSGQEWESFSVKIIPKDCYPFCFPIVIEEGGRIPRIADWHMYENGSCCFDVEPSEFSKCAEGLPVYQFLHKVVVPYFADQAFRIREGYYKGKEYAHGFEGIVEFLASKLDCDKDCKSVINALSKYLYLRSNPKVLKNFRNNPRGWNNLDKLPITYLKLLRKDLRRYLLLRNP